MKRNILEAIASRIQARVNCEASGNEEWLARHLEAIESICKEHLPRGSGFDSGTQFDEDNSRPDRVVFNTAFHHMDEGGFYDGWTEHQVIVVPSFVGGFSLRVTGRDRRQIKDYIADTFHHALSQVIDA